MLLRSFRGYWCLASHSKLNIPSRDVKVTFDQEVFIGQH